MVHPFVATSEGLVATSHTHLVIELTVAEGDYDNAARLQHAIDLGEDTLRLLEVLHTDADDHGIHALTLQRPAVWLLIQIAYKPFAQPPVACELQREQNVFCHRLYYVAPQRHSSFGGYQMRTGINTLILPSLCVRMIQRCLPSALKAGGRIRGRTNRPHYHMKSRYGNNHEAGGEKCDPVS